MVSRVWVRQFTSELFQSLLRQHFFFPLELLLFMIQLFNREILLISIVNVSLCIIIKFISS